MCNFVEKNGKKELKYVTFLKWQRVWPRYKYFYNHTKWNVLDIIMIIIIPAIQKNSFISCKVFNHFKGRRLKSETRHKIKTRKRKMCQQSDERKLFQSHGMYYNINKKERVDLCFLPPFQRFRDDGTNKTLGWSARWRERIIEEKANELTLCQRLFVCVSHQRFMRFWSSQPASLTCFIVRDGNYSKYSPFLFIILFVLRCVVGIHLHGSIVFHLWKL